MIMHGLDDRISIPVRGCILLATASRPALCAHSASSLTGTGGGGIFRQG